MLRPSRSRQAQPLILVMLFSTIWGGLSVAVRADGPAVIVGNAYVIDGDTVSISRAGQQTKVRLNGVDAPETDTRAGRAARLGLVRIVGNQALRCELNGERSHDRLIGSCYLPDGTDIGRALIAAGFALECPRYSGGRYRDVEVARGRLPAAPYCRVK